MKEQEVNVNMTSSALEDEEERRQESGFLTFLRKLRKRPEAIIAISILVLIIVLSLLSPWLCKYSYKTIDGASVNLKPSLEHPFGTDQLGRDILSRVLYGARYSLPIGVLSVAIGASLGLILGSIAGFFGGAADMIIMRGLDIFHAIPQVLMAVVVSTVLGPGLFQTILACGVGAIPNFARVIRANILSVRSLEYVEAAESINCNKARIIFRHVIPNSLTPFIVQISIAVANGLIIASTLSYIGLGVQPPAPEWGAMLADARGLVRQYPTQMLFPGLFIMVCVMSFNLIGDAIRDVLDPKLNK